MSEWGAHSLQEIGIGLAITLPLSVAYGYLWVYVGTKLELTEDVHGSPKYLNHANIVGSAFLAPIAYVAWLNSGLALEPYLRQQWLEDDARETQWLEVLLIYVFIWHFLKDLPIGVAPLLALHHVASIVAGVAFLSIGPPGLYTWGGANLLIGDILQCFALIRPDSMPVWRVNLVVNTVTNLVGFWCAYILFTVVGTPEVMRWIFGSSAVLFSAVRQFELVNMYGDASKRLSSGAAESMGADVELNTS